MPPHVSVIVPVLHDRAQLAALIASLERPAEMELIVVDGAGDRQLASLQHAHADVVWLASAPGRALQMNRGAAAARGRWLLFLHADSRLPPDWMNTLRDAESARAVGGSFRFALLSDARAARVIERGVAWRVRRLNLPYGDQALFVRRDVFEELGGFKTMPLMEDVEFVRRLSRRGRLFHSTRPVTSSARRWEHDGWVWRTALNVAILGLYFLGVNPSRLAKLYKWGLTP
jgi:rSAM/selenodomain-associated transferase 2